VEVSSKNKINKNNWIFIFCLNRITIKTRLVLQKLLNYNPIYDQPMYAQHQTAHKEDDKIDDDDILQRQKLLAKEPEIPEKYGFISLSLSLLDVKLFY